ncbi:MAG TPA: hypothetical protein VHO46_01950 [Bacteroidales bacterium]|nr:hypothetical protein [Bacteroidales bacterium]
MPYGQPMAIAKLSTMPYALRAMDSSTTISIDILHSLHINNSNVFRKLYYLEELFFL